MSDEIQNESKITVTTQLPLDERKEIEQQVHRSIKDFESWFEKRGNEPLVGAEVAIIKTFLFYMLFEEPSCLVTK